MKMTENINDNKDDTSFAGDLPLGDEANKKFNAIVNERAILEIAKLLQSVADLDLEVEAVDEQKKVIKRRVSFKEYFSSGLKKIFKTLDVVLGWLEQSAKNARREVETKKNNDTTDGQSEVDCQTQQYSDEYQKKEGVLRGLYHITALGSHSSLVELLELACKFLDLPENPYQAEREHVKICLQEVEERKQQVSELVEKACNILEEIIREPQFNHAKAHKFDSIVGQASIIIQSCKGLLSMAEETIDELMENMSIMKNFSRLLRLTGFGVTCFGLYHMTPTFSSVDSLANYLPSTGLSLIKKAFFSSKLNYVGLAGACAASGYAWMSLYPSRAYSFRDDLTDLKLKHERLTRGLHTLEERLKIVVKHMDKAKNREDSVLKCDKCLYCTMS